MGPAGTGDGRPKRGTFEPPVVYQSSFFVFEFSSLSHPPTQHCFEPPGRGGLFVKALTALNSVKVPTGAGMHVKPLGRFV